MQSDEVEAVVGENDEPMASRIVQLTFVGMGEDAGFSSGDDCAASGAQPVDEWLIDALVKVRGRYGH
ncbi:MAG: hypothetical protein QOF51_198 [Chloroflexota bacterium]|jgi:hypothetical protein|nr:hypothetical protein [Chloroflexota bacterium]